MIGVTLLVAGIGAGFTGYSLPDDLLSGTGLRIIYSAVLSIPVVGTWLAFLLFGGEFPSPELIPRLFVMHILLIPATIVALLSAHLALVWHQTHTQFRPVGTGGHGDRHARLAEVRSEVGRARVHDLRGSQGLGGLVQINPVWLYGPFVAYSAPSPAQPDFYAGWLEGILRLWPNWSSIFGHTIGELFLPAVVIPGIIFTILGIWPFLEARETRHRAAPRRAASARRAPAQRRRGGGIALFVLLMLAGSNDVLAKYLQVEVDSLNEVLKVLAFVVPVIVGTITWWVCRDLRDRGADPSRAHRGSLFRRNDRGGFDEIHDELPDGTAGGRAGEPTPIGGGAMTLPMPRAAGRGGRGGRRFVAASCSSSFGMPRGSSEQGREIFDLWQIFFWAGIVVAAIVYGLIAWSLVRYRRRRREAEAALGRQFHANVPLEIVYTAIPVVMVVVLFSLSFATEDRASSVTPDPDLTLRAEAFSWGWRFGFPDAGVEVVSEPSGGGVPGPEIRLPVGETTRIELTSNDVIHAFWVPDFLYKRDAIPGHVNVFDVTPTETGTYHGVCSEFAGCTTPT